MVWILIIASNQCNRIFIDLLLSTNLQTAMDTYQKIQTELNDEWVMFQYWHMSTKQIEQEQKILEPFGVSYIL